MADDAKWQGLLGENLAAQHYVKQSGVDVDEFAQRFLDEWMKSRPHRDNLAFRITTAPGWARRSMAIPSMSPSFSPPIWA